MARTNEPSEPANTLPYPELNPLQNPLLSENINRWAEVYFNNPPERRDAAVVELLEELLEERRQRSEQYRKENPAFIPQSREVPPVSGIPDNIVHCRACDAANPATHQFCGSCGQSLQAKEPRAQEREVREADRQVQGTIDAAPATPQIPSTELHEPATNNNFLEFEPPADEAGEIPTEEYESRSYSPAVANNDLSLFQSLRAPAGEDDEEDWEYGPQRSSSYRYYIAAVLTILILGLGYLAWHSGQFSQTSHEGSPLPPNPATESAPAPAASTPSSPSAKADSTGSAGSKSATEPTAKNIPPTSDNRDAQEGDSRQKAGQNNDALTKASQTQPMARATATPVASHPGAGSEELATAQRYLTGANGQARDSSEAAKWLWKAISKHNGQATLMLADLYLKGDGVSKNCDQGRVLLDSAAQKGIPGAGERLRNLQAFGCR